MRMRPALRRRILMASVTAVLVPGFMSASWAAVPGDLDTGFSDDGHVLLPDQQVAVEALGSGKALAVSTGWVVRRFTQAGPRDLSYGGGDGIATAAFGTDVQRASDAALQPDGKLLVVGTVTEGATTMTAVARFTAAGVLDPTFSGDGMRTIGMGAAGFLGGSIAMAPTGMIVIAGSTGTGTARDAAAVLLTNEGARVGAFGGGDGLATVDVAGDQDVGEGVAVQPDGRIVVVTSTVRSTDSMAVMGVVRLTADGALDASFSQDGRVLITFRSDVPSWGGSTGADVAVHATTGEVAVGGSVMNGTDEDAGPSFAIARLDGSGTVVRRWTTLGLGDHAVVRAIDLIGRDVVAVGWFRISVADCCGWLVARFGRAGWIREVFLPGEYNSGASDVSIVGAKAYVVGSVEATVNGQWRRGAIARFIA